MTRLYLLVFLCALPAWAADDKPAPAKPGAKAERPGPVDPPADKAAFHLFLLAGQSNMSGRGKPEAEDLTPHPRVLALNKAGKWAPAVAPLHWEHPGCGVGLGEAFGKAVADRDPSITVGLIPAACGGSGIRVWQPGVHFKITNSKPYDDAIARAKAAMRHGTLKAILWHQGESDGYGEHGKLYKERLADLVARFREDLGIPDLIVVVAELGKTGPWRKPEHDLVDQGLYEVARADARIGHVKTEGLTCKADKIHFDAKSLRELGRRYAVAYEVLSNPPAKGK